MTYRITLWNDEKRELAKSIIDKAPVGARLELSEPKRTKPQNDRLWSMLGEIAVKAKWRGQKLAPEDWKLIFMSGLKRELRVAPNFDGDGFIALGQSSSRLSVSEMSDLFALIEAWCAREGIALTHADER
jgi:hypothetical protein